MMTNEEFMSQLLAPYEPQGMIGDIVIEVNKAYHAFEAESYDSIHPEITRQLPPIWESMIRHGTAQHPATQWKILDFGCGTGFEATQMLRCLPQGSIAQLTCYDPSPEMLERCQAKVKPIFPQAMFCTSLDMLPQSSGGYNILATNSLLHHLPDPVATINGLLPLLTPNAVWLAGHEPSSRFYKNAACLATYQAFTRERSWKRYLQPDNYVQRLKVLMGKRVNPAAQAADAVYRKGLFNRLPPPSIIGRLVDFYVAHSAEEANAGRGLDFEQLQRAFEGTWRLAWVRSYAFMGPYYENTLSQRWRRCCQELSAQYPNDGANFSTVWSRV